MSASPSEGDGNYPFDHSEGCPLRKIAILNLLLLKHSHGKHERARDTKGLRPKAHFCTSSFLADISQGRFSFAPAVHILLPQTPTAPRGNLITHQQLCKTSLPHRDTVNLLCLSIQCEDPTLAPMSYACALSVDTWAQLVWILHSIQIVYDTMVSKGDAQGVEDLNARSPLPIWVCQRGARSWTPP
eukprot:546969-Pelagomonas_calceolata.AAC.1